MLSFSLTGAGVSAEPGLSIEMDEIYDALARVELFVAIGTAGAVGLSGKPG